jgi:short-subunit dehydrogenase
MDYRHALITGASSGIGRSLALRFARKGVKVFAAARRTESLESLAREAGDGQIEPVRMDVSDAKRTRAQIQELDERCGGLDLVVANAGVGIETYGKRLNWDDVEQTIAINVTGAAATLTAALPQMVERNRGHLVGIASLAAFRGLPRMGAYCASKAFLSTFMESLRVDLGRTAVKVSCIYPGYVKSEMTSKNKFKMPFLLETEEAVAKIGKAIERAAPTFVFPWPMALAMKSIATLPPSIFDVAAQRLR